MKITIIAGTGEDRDGNAIGERELHASMKRIRTRLAEMFGGFTETAHVGGWVNGDGRLVIEPGTAWTLFTDAGEGSARIAADYVRNALNQASVGLAIEPAAVRWIEAEEREAEAA